jgi:hypothetical protein
MLCYGTEIDGLLKKNKKTYLADILKRILLKFKRRETERRFFSYPFDRKSKYHNWLLVDFLSYNYCIGMYSVTLIEENGVL